MLPELGSKMKEFIFPRGYFESKAWQNHKTIRQFLMSGPKTFNEICKVLEQDRKLKNARSSTLYALRVMLRAGEVIGELTAQTLELTGDRLTPLFRLTAGTVVYHGGAPKDSPTNGSDYSIMRLYTDAKGTPIARQYFKKVKRKLAKGYTYRKISPILALDNTGEICARFDSWPSFWNWKRTHENLE